MNITQKYPEYFDILKNNVSKKRILANKEFLNGLQMLTLRDRMGANSDEIREAIKNLIELHFPEALFEPFTVDVTDKLTGARYGAGENWPISDPNISDEDFEKYIGSQITIEPGKKTWSMMESKSKKTTISKIVKKKKLDTLIENTLKEVGIKKSLVNEEMFGPVNYDNQIAAELKAEVGDLDKLIPYVLKKGEGNMDVQMGADGKVHLTDVSTKKKVGLYKNVDDFLRGIGYQIKMESTSSDKSLINEELSRFNKLISFNYKY